MTASTLGAHLLVQAGQLDPAGPTPGLREVRQARRIQRHADRRALRAARTLDRTIMAMPGRDRAELFAAARRA